MKNLDEYKYLWDGTEPGWKLQHLDKVEWKLVFKFIENGKPTQKELRSLWKLVPELQHYKLPELYKYLKNKSEYSPMEKYGNIEARNIYEKAEEIGLVVTMTGKQKGGYLPISTNTEALLIEDEEIEEVIIKKMLAAGVKVEEIHVD